jgi:hypothetical protein
MVSHLVVLALILGSVFADSQNKEFYLKPGVAEEEVSITLVRAYVFLSRIYFPLLIIYRRIILVCLPTKVLVVLVSNGS